jgi:branched-chain amino acid aminotransferase
MLPTITRADQLKPKPEESNLGFGIHFTDYMFNMDYTPEKRWYNPRIEPYAFIEMDPA